MLLSSPSFNVVLVWLLRMPYGRNVSLFSILFMSIRNRSLLFIQALSRKVVEVRALKDVLGDVQGVRIGRPILIVVPPCDLPASWRGGVSDISILKIKRSSRFYPPFLFHRPIALIRGFAPKLLRCRNCDRSLAPIVRSGDGYAKHQGRTYRTQFCASAGCS